MKMCKEENFDADFAKNGAYLGALPQKNSENSAYLAPPGKNPKTREEEKFIIEYGESLAEGDLRPVLLENYNGDK